MYFFQGRQKRGRAPGQLVNADPLLDTDTRSAPLENFVNIFPRHGEDKLCGGVRKV